MRTKRGTAPPGTFEAWVPYYAGFPALFAQEVLADLPRGTVVVDPWNGSGTTTSVAASLGLVGIGGDLNPVARVLALGRLYAPAADEFEACARRGLDAAGSEQVTLAAGDPLLKWFDGNTTALWRKFERELVSQLHPIGQFVGEPSRRSFIKVMLSLAARRSAQIRPGSNPTWIRPPQIPVALTEEEVRNAVLDEIQRATVVVGSQPAGGPGFVEPRVWTWDARSLPLRGSTVDLIVTSPPYCTRIDYAVSTLFETAMFMCGSREDLRLRLMGTTRVRKGERMPVPVAPDVRVLLERIRTHGSYEAAGYYYKNFSQYFSDAHRSVAEIARVLKPGGRALLVVQSSYFKDILMDLPDLFVAIGQFLNLDAEVVSSTAVTRSLVDINAAARVRRSRRECREAVVQLTRNG